MDSLLSTTKDSMVAAQQLRPYAIFSSLKGEVQRPLSEWQISTWGARAYFTSKSSGVHVVDECAIRHTKLARHDVRLGQHERFLYLHTLLERRGQLDYLFHHCVLRRDGSLHRYAHGTVLMRRRE